MEYIYFCYALWSLKKISVSKIIELAIIFLKEGCKKIEKSIGGVFLYGRPLSE